MKRYLAVFMLVVMLVLMSSNAALAGPKLQGEGSIYYVTWGDTLSGIALRYGVTAEAILMQNGLTNPEMIYVGQPLVIPNWGYSGESANFGASGCANHHKVGSGETLSSIAWRYNVSMPDLLHQNNLYNKDFLFVGQMICLPAQIAYAPQNVGYQHAPPAPVSSHYHMVTNGETLSNIAYRYGVDQWNIVRANSLSNAAYIWTGQELIIPGYQPKPQHNTPAPMYNQPVVVEPYDNPPAAPALRGDHNDSCDGPCNEPPPYEDPDGSESELEVHYVSDPPEYEPAPVYPLLPEAEHPIEVVVNGGETWVGESFNKADPDSITTLIVGTGEEGGKLVRLRSGDAEIKGEIGPAFNGEFGSYRFVVRHITPGDYDVWIEDPDGTPGEVSKVHIGAGERVEVFFEKQVRFQGQTFASPDGWVLTSWKNPSEPGKIIGGWSNILVRTPATGLWVMIEAEGGGFKAKCLTGSKGPGACEFGGLSAGLYNIWIDGTQFTVKTYVDGNAYAEFDLSHQ